MWTTLRHTYIRLGGVVRQGGVGVDGDVFRADQRGVDGCALSGDLSGVSDDVDLEGELRKARLGSEEGVQAQGGGGGVCYKVSLSEW